MRKPGKEYTQYFNGDNWCSGLKLSLILHYILVHMYVCVNVYKQVLTSTVQDLVLSVEGI